MNQLEIREEAERDIFDATLWYEQERAGFGFRLETELSGVIGRVVATPLQFPVVGQGVRRALLKSFPYGVFFVFEGRVVIVLGVLHLHRHPNAWKLRT